MVVVLGRAKSKESEGVSMSEYVIDFRRLGGKNPSVLRERRAISTATGEGSMRTQESCFHSGSSVVGLVVVLDREVVKLDEGGELGSCRGSYLGRAVADMRIGIDFSLLLLRSPGRSRVAIGSGILRPLTSQDSTGR